jgi:hypothetical protein
MRDQTPFPLVFDSVSVLSDVFFTNYTSFGAEFFTTYKKIGIMAGIRSVTDMDNMDSAYTWPNNALPYPQPRIAYVLSPLFGQWHGLSASSRLMLSESRPFLKARTALSYKTHPLQGRQHILLDMVYDYWGNRDPIVYGDSSNWSGEINNLSFSVAVEIKTFSLFYKIDNILNRNFAYVPGYRMPGITFRWGFQWLLPG